MALSPTGSGERQPCRLGICDGSGWILGPEDVARPCECRSRMVAQARLRGIDSVIPPKYRGVSFDRPPVTQMDAFVVKRVRDFCADSTRTSTTAAACGSSAAPEPARRRSRC